MRTIIDLESKQISQLDAWAKAEGISRAEAVRRAVAQLLERSQTVSNAGFGLWSQGAAVPPERDGLALQIELRDEWPQ